MLNRWTVLVGALLTVLALGGLGAPSPAGGIPAADESMPSHEMRDQ